jgi:streptogramin lyase
MVAADASTVPNNCLLIATGGVNIVHRIRGHTLSMDAKRSRIAGFVAAAALTAVVGTAAAAVPTVRFKSPPTDLAGGETLWVSLAGDGALVRLEPRTGRVLARIDVHRADPRALGAGPLAAGGKQLWIAAPVHVDDDPVVGNASGWIGHVGIRGGKLRITQVHGDPPFEIGVGLAGVWVTGGHTVRRVDARTGVVVGTLRLPAYLGAVAVGTNAVWVDEPNTGRLVEIDPRTRKVRGSVAIGRSTGRGALAIVGGAVWAATNNALVRVDQQSRRVTARLPVPGASAIGFGLSRLWVVGRDGVYSIRAGKVTKELSVARGGAELITVARGAVWLSAGSTNSLRRIEP